MRLVFMGTPAFAVPSLRRLHADGHEIRLVLTQPDRPAGRGRRLRPPPVKEAAAALGLPVLQPEKVRGAAIADRLRALAPDAMVIVAFGQLLPREILEIAPHGCLNVHASLLPAYRGAAPIAWALIRGEEETGITIMRLDEGMDSGPILLSRREAIRPEDTAGTLGDRLAALGADALSEALAGLAAGTIEPRPQDHSRATFAPKLTQAHCRIVWDRPAVAIHNQVRGLSPEPGAFTTWEGRILKVLATAPLGDGGGGAPPGTILSVGPETLVIATGQGPLHLVTVLPENRRPMTGAEFARGARLQRGGRLGEVPAGAHPPKADWVPSEP